MMSPLCERAAEDATRYGKAILKFISANDIGLTGGHQYGFYLPKAVWQVFTPHLPQKGINSDHHVTVLWPDGRQTSSIIKWYGQRTRSEYRLTRFGRNFQWRTFDNLGDMLVLIPKSQNDFIAYVLDIDEDIEEIQAALGVEVLESWNFYEKGQTQAEIEDTCLNRHFRTFAEKVEKFPGVKVFSDTTRIAIIDCVMGFNGLTADEQLVRLIREEYTLYRMVERKIFQPEVRRLFATIDDFLQTAQRILQARKSRAGRSLENHIEYLLKQTGIPHQMRQVVDGTRPDILIPGKAEYNDPAFPNKKLFMVGVKMTCKDRWRQVTKEAPRIKRKHILTLQKGISGKQLDEMQRAKVTLIVPEALHKEYPPEGKAIVLSVNAFIDTLIKTYSA
jgi:type II restriction enzyme